MRNKYFLMVCSLRQSSWATSRLLSPSATRATTCSSRGVRSFTPKALTIRREGTCVTTSIKYWSCSLFAHTWPWCTLLYALTEQAEGILGKSEQAFGAGAKSIGHEVSVVGTQQENLCYLWVRQ